MEIWNRLNQTFVERSTFFKPIRHSAAPSIIRILSYPLETLYQMFHQQFPSTDLTHYSRVGHACTVNSLLTPYELKIGGSVLAFREMNEVILIESVKKYRMLHEKERSLP